MYKRVQMDQGTSSHSALGGGQARVLSETDMEVGSHQ